MVCERREYWEGDRRDVELARHPGDKRLDWLVEIGERRARMAQQGKLHGIAETVGVAAAVGHQVQVRTGQGEPPCQGVGVGRDAQQRPALLVGQQLSACQSSSPVPQTPEMNIDGPALGDVVCGRARASPQRVNISAKC